MLFNRIEQVNWLKNMASDIASYSGGETPSDAAAAVDMWLVVENTPPWFTTHDLNLLIDMVAENLSK